MIVIRVTFAVLKTHAFSAMQLVSFVLSEFLFVFDP